MSNNDSPRSQTKIEQECYDLMKATRPFWWFLKCGGRWPLESYVEDRLIKFRLNRWGPSFVVFIITTLFLLICTSQASRNIVELVSDVNITTSYGE